MCAQLLGTAISTWVSPTSRVPERTWAPPPPALCTSVNGSLVFRGSGESPRHPLLFFPSHPTSDLSADPVASSFKMFPNLPASHSLPATALLWSAAIGSLLDVDIPSSLLSLLPSWTPAVESQPQSHRDPVPLLLNTLHPQFPQDKSQGLRERTRPGSIAAHHGFYYCFFLSPLKPRLCISRFPCLQCSFSYKSLFRCRLRALTPYPNRPCSFPVALTTI